jgi:tetratricopeptide (TPR) repeat protein
VIAVAAEVNDDATIQREFDRLAQIAPKWDLPVAWQTDRLRRIRLGQAIDFLQQELARRPDAGLELRMAYPRLLVGAKRFPKPAAFRSLATAEPGQRGLAVCHRSAGLSVARSGVADQRLSAALQQRHPEPTSSASAWGRLPKTGRTRRRRGNGMKPWPAGQQYLPAQADWLHWMPRPASWIRPCKDWHRWGRASRRKCKLAMQQADLARHAKRYDLSYRILSQALESWPRSPELLYDRALVSDQLGNLGDAERDLKALLKEKPDDTQALNALGYTLANRSNRHQEALGYIEKALKADPDNPMIQDSMGWVLFKLGRTEAALKYLERSYAACRTAK